MHLTLRRSEKGTPSGTYGVMLKDDGTSVIPFTLEPINPVSAGGPFRFVLRHSPHLDYTVWTCSEMEGHSFIEGHIGNTIKDTIDCFLCGNYRGNVYDRNGLLIGPGILHSKDAFDAFMAATAGETELQITYEDPT